jgi:hypothetical protein
MLSEELARLITLHREGALTDEEFAQAKEALLANTSSTNSYAEAVSGDRHGSQPWAVPRSSAPRSRPTWVTGGIGVAVAALVVLVLVFALTADEGSSRPGQVNDAQNLNVGKILDECDALVVPVDGGLSEMVLDGYLEALNSVIACAEEQGLSCGESDYGSDVCTRPGEVNGVEVVSYLSSR